MAERIEGLSIGLDLDSLALDRGLKGLKDRLQTVNSEMKANMSAFDRADKTVEKYETRLQGLNKKLEVQQRVVSESKAEYEKMVKEYGEGSKEAEKAAREYNKQVTSLNNLNRYIERTTKEMQDLQEEQRKANSGWTKMGASIEQTGTKLSDLGKKMSSTVTPAISALGIGLGTIADAADRSSTKIQRTLGLTANQAKELTGISRELWKEGMGEGVEDVDRAILQVRQNMRGLSDKELKQVTKDAMYLAETFDADVNEVTRAGNNLMKGFGITAEEAFDLMAWGGQKGLNFSNELFDNLSEYSTLFAKMGFSSEEYFQLLEKGSSAGVYNLDYINDLMKEFQIRLKDGSKGTSDAMGELSKGTQDVWKQYLKGEKTVKDVHNTVIKELKGMENQTKANEIAVGLYGTKFEDLEADAVYAMGEIDGSLKDLDGAMKRSGDAVEKSFGERARIAWRKTQDALLPLGETLLDIAEKALPPVTNGIEWMTKKFDEMNPSMKQGIIIAGGVVAAIGPLAMGFGAVASAIAPILPMIAGAGGVGAGLMSLANPIGRTVAALGTLGVGFLALDSYMDKPIIKSDKFAGKVSDTTKQILGEYDKLEQESHSYLTRMATGNEEVTQTHVDNIVAMYKEMTSQVLKQLDTRYQGERAKLVEMLNQNQTLSAEDKAKTLASFDEHYAQERQKVLDNENQKIEITKQMQGATEQERMAHYSKIMEIDKNNSEILLENTAKTKDEYLTIQSNLKNEAGIISAEKAAKYVADSKETTEKVVSEANKKAEEEIAAITYQRDVTGTISAEQAKQLIGDAEYRRDQVVSTAQDEHYAVVKAAQQQAGEHVDEVNWETGSVLSAWDKMWNGIANVWNPIADLFGADKMAIRGEYKINDRQRKKNQDASFSKNAYAKGTKNGTHQGGMALVGEEGFELAYIPNEGYTLLGTKGPEILNLPAFSAVLPHEKTKQILNGYNFPGYAEGVGDWSLFEWLGKGAKSLWEHMIEKTGFYNNVSMPDWFPSIKNIMGKISEGAITKIDKLIDQLGFSGVSQSGSGVQRWAGLAAQALAMTGQYSEANLQRMLMQMQTESSGNPRSINLWDSNAKRGTPSKGLMQVIDPTFRSYAMPGFNTNIYDPLSNMLASIRYSIARYGSLSKAWRGVGYKSGGLINIPGMYQLAEGGYPEFVIPTDPSMRTDAMKLLALAGKQIQGNKRPNQLPNVNDIDNNALERLLAATLDQTKVLLQLLNKNQSVIIDGREVAIVTSSYLDEINTVNTIRSRKFGGDPLG